MEFKIVNETYSVAEGENPERYGFIEGYTSNSEDFLLRINCGRVIDEEWVDWHKRVYGEVPTVPTEPSYYLDQKGCHVMRAGDVLMEGVRLNPKQVKQLIEELWKWLKEAEAEGEKEVECVFSETDMGNETAWECSNCGEAFCYMKGSPKDNQYEYCPKCGAKIIAVEELQEKDNG